MNLTKQLIMKTTIAKFGTKDEAENFIWSYLYENELQYEELKFENGFWILEYECIRF